MFYPINILGLKNKTKLTTELTNLIMGLDDRGLIPADTASSPVGPTHPVSYIRRTG